MSPPRSNKGNPPPSARHDQWRAAYAANRYLRDKTLEHVTARLRYLMEAILTLSPNGLIGVEEGDDKVGGWLWLKFTHTIHELALRGTHPPDNFLAGAQVPHHTHLQRPPELTCYEQRKNKAPGQVFKYGEKKWMEAALRQGSFRFAGALTYNDPSLNAAVHDDELSLTIYPTKTSYRGVLGVPSSAPDGGLTLTHPTDYYVQCFSTRFALRMFKDFEADACLIVYDAREFGKRLFNWLGPRFPDWIIGSIPVSYVDPDDPGDAPLPIPAAKHMKYAYQCEERIVCHPLTQRFARLQAVPVSLGSLEDIAEVIHLP